MQYKHIIIVCAVLFGSVLGFGTHTLSAQNLTDEREAQLRAELADLEKQIEAQQAILRTQQRQSVSIERDIAILTAKINEAQLKIRSKNLSIERLGADITAKSKTIVELESQLERGKESLAQVIRKTNEIDDFSLTEVILSNENLSDFFVDIDAYTSLKRSLNGLFEEIREVQDITETERTALDAKRKAEMDARKVIEKEKGTVERSEDQKQELLAASKASEQVYESILSEREKRASQIRATLFGLRDSAAIPFGDALRYAEIASEKTGVRPAFILAILKQESNLGENVGTCNRPQDPPEKHWKEIMKPSRDFEPYLRITSALGLDPESMPLSCPWGGGWGGAMGPSQFIPSTWELYASRIASAVGVSVASPWNAQHAVMATALFVADLGADEGGYSAEREAALRYYAGGNWWKPQNAFYGNGVMAKADDIQVNMIDPLRNF